MSSRSVWFPLAAALTAANTAENTIAPRLLAPLPAEVRYVLGDTHYLVLLYQHEHKGIKPLLSAPGEWIKQVREPT